MYQSVSFFFFFFLIIIIIQNLNKYTCDGVFFFFFCIIPPFCSKIMFALFKY